MKQIKNKRPTTAKQYISIGLAVLGLIIGEAKAVAIEREGIVINKRRIDVVDREVLVRVDEKRPYDHIITLGDINFDGIGSGLDMMIENGSVVRFDDDGLMPSTNGIKYVGQNRIISVNGMSVLDMFPGQEKYFLYANAARKRQQSLD